MPSQIEPPICALTDLSIKSFFLKKPKQYNTDKKSNFYVLLLFTHLYQQLSVKNTSFP